MVQSQNWTDDWLSVAAAHTFRRRTVLCGWTPMYGSPTHTHTSKRTYTRTFQHIVIQFVCILRIIYDNLAAINTVACEFLYGLFYYVRAVNGSTHESKSISMRDDAHCVCLPNEWPSGLQQTRIHPSVFFTSIHKL